MSICCILIGLSLAGTALQAPSPDQLAERIDQQIDEALRAKQIASAAIANDAEFLRRVSLDVIGRIPTEAEAREFLADADTAKRANLIDRLLEDPRHAEHFARTWRGLLLPEAETDLQVDYFRPGLEAWLREHREKNLGFDQIVRELIAVPISGNKTSPEMVLLDLRQPNPLGYFAAKEATPENIAAATTRLFLGIRLECAQCHDHPFADWTQNQFWNQAAFFGGIERQGKGVFSPLIESPGLHDIAIELTNDRASALFLNGGAPVVGADESPRTAFAAWLTAPDNPHFAKAAVNRVWGQLMGVGLVEPVDDFQDGNPPSHPELLDGLAAAFVESGFDLTYLIGAICRTNAYQRTSEFTGEEPDDPQAFARMAIKPLSGEQFVESVLSALGHPRENDPLRVGRNRDPLERQLLDLFATAENHHDPQTSILQALTLMNGELINDAVVMRKSPTLSAAIERSDEPIAARVESLYLITLSRLPSESEQQRLTMYLSEGGEDELPRRMGDVLWMLLNTMEFRCNH